MVFYDNGLFWHFLCSNCDSVSDQFNVSNFKVSISPFVLPYRYKNIISKSYSLHPDKAAKPIHQDIKTKNKQICLDCEFRGLLRLRGGAWVNTSGGIAEKNTSGNIAEVNRQSELS